MPLWRWRSAFSNLLARSFSSASLGHCGDDDRAESLTRKRLLQ
jgi:hypothetical protein